jgi:glyoxylase-like metal-dependent hydrolase (beta-lactamase superfamily II)
MRGFEDEEDVREFAEAIAPLESAGQLDTSIEDRELSPGLSLRHAPGHTPGHRCVLLDTGGERVLFAGDLLHFTFQLNDPGFRSPGDDDPGEGSRTRAAWLDRAESERLTLATAHVPPSHSGGSVPHRERAREDQCGDEPCDKYPGDDCDHGHQRRDPGRFYRVKARPGPVPAESIHGEQQACGPTDDSRHDVATTGVRLIGLRLPDFVALWRFLAMVEV